MSKDRKTRPSFAPESSSGGEGGSTGWVYRSEADEGRPPEADDPWQRGFNPAKWVGRARRTGSRWSTRFLETASLPFALAIVTAMPAASWISRKLSRRGGSR
jgi:hypothetical protein